MCQILERKHGIIGPVCYLQDINTTCASERRKIQRTHETNEINLLEFQLSVIQTETYRLTHPIFKCIKYDLYNLQETPVYLKLM